VKGRKDQEVYADVEVNLHPKLKGRAWKIWLERFFEVQSLADFFP
jgi:hypothetical protein